MTPVISGVVKQQQKCECLAFNYKIATFAKQQERKKADELNRLRLQRVI